MLAFPFAFLILHERSVSAPPIFLNFLSFTQIGLCVFFSLSWSHPLLTGMECNTVRRQESESYQWWTRDNWVLYINPAKNEIRHKFKWAVDNGSNKKFNFLGLLVSNKELGVGWSHTHIFLSRKRCVNKVKIIRKKSWPDIFSLSCISYLFSLFLSPFSIVKFFLFSPYISRCQWTTAQVHI